MQINEDLERLRGDLVIDWLMHLVPWWQCENFQMIECLRYPTTYCLGRKCFCVCTYVMGMSCKGVLQPVWPDWANYWTLGNFLKPVATINLPKSPTFLGNFCKGVKIIHFSSELIFGQLLWTFGDFFWSHCWPLMPQVHSITGLTMLIWNDDLLTFELEIVKYEWLKSRELQWGFKSK